MSNARDISRDCYYIVELYKNGELFKSLEYVAKALPEGEYYRSERAAVELSDILSKDPSAEYTFRVKGLGDGADNFDGEFSKMSEPHYYTE